MKWTHETNILLQKSETTHLELCPVKQNEDQGMVFMNFIISELWQRQNEHD